MMALRTLLPKSLPKSLLVALLLLVTLSVLTACVPTLVTGTVVVVDVATDRRTAGRYWDDNTLAIKFRSILRSDSALDGSNISVTAFNGIVVLSGQVVNNSQRRYLRRRVQQYEKTASMRKLLNNVQVKPITNFGSRIHDAWITTKVKLRLMRSPKTTLKSVKVVTENDEVYLLGLVTRAEGEAAVAIAQFVKGVTRIYKVLEYTD